MAQINFTGFSGTHGDVEAALDNNFDELYAGASTATYYGQTVTANAYTVALTPTLSALATGVTIKVKFKDASTAASTLNADGLGAKKLYKNPTTQIGNGDITDEQIYEMTYDAALDGAAGGWLIDGYVGGGVGASAFTSLTDVPSSYTSQALKAVRVNAAANALEFYTPAGASTIELGFNVTIDGLGAVLTTGIKGDIEIPYNCTIVGWTLISDVSGSIVIDVWKDTYANYPPTIADTIAGSEKPTISAALKGQDLTLSSWTTACTKGDILRFNVDSVTSISRVTLSIRVTT